MNAILKDALLNRSGASWLAIRKFLYFVGVCIIAAILAGIGVSDAFAGVLRPSVGSVMLATAWRMACWLFVFLMPWEAYKAIQVINEYNYLLDKAEARAKEQEARADAFAHGNKYVEPYVDPVPSSPDFTVDRGDDPTVPIEQMPMPWQTDPKWKQKQEIAPIGFPKNNPTPQAAAAKYRTASYAEFCQRNGLK